jgi:hypothetical protein
MKKMSAVLLLCVLIASPSFARSKDRGHVRKSPSVGMTIVRYFLHVTGLEKADTPPPPPTWPGATTQDGGSCVDPNGCVKPKP